MSTSQPLDAGMYPPARVTALAATDRCELDLAAQRLDFEWKRHEWKGHDQSECGCPLNMLNCHLYNDDIL